LFLVSLGGENTDFPVSLIELLKNARRVVTLTGAGVSKESGIPTFREAQIGLWEEYDLTELATPEAFLRDPQRVWEWYEYRRGLVGQAEPNPGHFALAEMEKYVPEFTLVTQNVDGLHRKAGSQNIFELHGNILCTKCFENGHLVEDWQDTGEAPPACPECGSPLRPDVVWFGEALPTQAIEAAYEAAQTAEVFFSVGTSALVHPAASLPYLALREGATVIEINLEETVLTKMVHYSLRGESGKILPELLKQVWKE
jgi:NAD-dependent deacetylase